jgi:hypothetical protein
MLHIFIVGSITSRQVFPVFFMAEARIGKATKAKMLLEFTIFSHFSAKSNFFFTRLAKFRRCGARRT